MPKILGPKKIWVKKNVEPKKIFSQKNSWSKKILVTKCFDPKILGKRNVGTKIFLVQQRFWSQKYFGLKIWLKILEPKQILVKKEKFWVKHFWVKEILNPKKSWVQSKC